MVTPRKPKSEHKPDGRPRIYDEKFNHMAFVACSEGGFTDKKLAMLFGVNEKTINAWKKDFPKFCKSILEGKDIADCQKVEKSFFKIANGYSYNETIKKPIILKDAEGNPIITETGRPKTKMVVTKVTRKHVAPNEKAGEFWLRNRQQERWPDKQNIDHGISKDLIDHSEKLAAARERKQK